jgi:hypothetical protein
MFEGPVLNQLGIKSAVGAVVDVFEKQSVQGGRDGDSWFVRLHSDAGGFGGAGLGQRRNVG